MQCLNRNRNSELSELTRDGGIIIFEIPLWAIVQDITSTAEKTMKDQLYIFLLTAEMNMMQFPSGRP